uniref:Uncharacterized protein LOC104248519 n=1 Tax=Nicotiana sylvestris TaxID=4096 RepID=A0A1U7YIY7_NICSY|nr:PREDICTED: uncharacterized protein LOC104248519 [Nicotiana sylvestris]
MANMVGQVLESHKITFHEDELPPKGLSHNRALHITMQFEDKFIARVLIDGGSSLNICPLTTLKRIIITYPNEPTTVTCDETTQHKDSDSKDLEDDIIPEEIVREVENFENKPKFNLDETKDTIRSKWMKRMPKRQPLSHHGGYTGETPYLLVYGTEVVIPAEIEIPSLRIIQEAELSDAEWVQS